MVYETIDIDTLDSLFPLDYPLHQNVNNLQSTPRELLAPRSI
jgi:hypothetical protein